MTRFILDTDQRSLLQYKHPAILQRVAALPPDELASTVITTKEQLRCVRSRS